MKKLVNHVDHVTWICRLENLETNVAKLEKLADAKMTRFERRDMGFVMYLCWEAGLEMVAPLDEPTEFCRMMNHWLNTRGEGVMSIVYGVRNLEKHRQRVEALGYQVGPIMDDHVDSPWHEKLVLHERVAGEFLGSLFILGDIDYADGVIPFEDA